MVRSQMVNRLGLQIKVDDHRQIFGAHNLADETLGVLLLNV